MRAGFLVGFIAFLAACGSKEPRVPDADEMRAARYAERAERSFRSGAREDAFRLATRALVVRLAACGYACPEVGVSFVQLGDFRLENGQADWAAQSYRKALEVLLPHEERYAKWILAAKARLALAEKHIRR